MAFLTTVALLAKRVGLNVNKLQDGFQSIYNDTVNGYVQKTRLEIARNLLMITEFNISEIVRKIGLSSKSYFSKIFKEEYQISPSEFRRNRKEANKATADKM
jgi:AraC-like DNA-binding protein